MVQVWDTARAFLMVLPPIIFLHETGHFLAARWCGVRVVRFSLGFGPRIFGFTHGGTEYQLAWIPLGGYVKMAGDSPEAAERTDAPDEFLNQVWWKKAIIAAAGPAMNLVLAYVALVAMYRIGGRFEDYPAVLGRLAPGIYAEKLGLRTGDQMLAVDGRGISSWMNFYVALSGPESEKHAEHRVQYRRSAGGGTVQFSDKQVGDFLNGLVAQRPPVIGSVMVGQPAYVGGLKDGDRIISVDGRPIREWTDLTDVIFVNASKPLRFKVQREGREMELWVTPQQQEDGVRGGRIGIAPVSTEYYYSKGVSWPRALVGAWSSTWMQVGETYAGFGKILTRPRQFSQQVGGPIMITQLASYEARRGVSDMLWFGAFISVAIMAFNLLPIPILDGGHVAFSLVEAIQRRPLSVGQLVVFQRIGLTLLGSILIFVLLNDSWRLVQRARNVSVGEQKGHAVTQSP